LNSSVSDLWKKTLIVSASAIVTVYACEAFLFWDPLELLGPHPRRGFDLRNTSTSCAIYGRGACRRITWLMSPTGSLLHLRYKVRPPSRSQRAVRSDGYVQRTWYLRDVRK
jgi:hypothetical protein